MKMELIMPDYTNLTAEFITCASGQVTARALRERRKRLLSELARRNERNLNEDQVAAMLDEIARINKVLEED